MSFAFRNREFWGETFDNDPPELFGSINRKESQLEFHPKIGMQNLNNDVKNFENKIICQQILKDIFDQCPFPQEEVNVNENNLSEENNTGDKENDAQDPDVDEND